MEELIVLSRGIFYRRFDRAAITRNTRTCQLRVNLFPYDVHVQPLSSIFNHPKFALSDQATFSKTTSNRCTTWHVVSTAVNLAGTFGRVCKNLHRRGKPCDNKDRLPDWKRIARVRRRRRQKARRRANLAENQARSTARPRSSINGTNLSIAGLKMAPQNERRKLDEAKARVVELETRYDAVTNLFDQVKDEITRLLEENKALRASRDGSQRQLLGLQEETQWLQQQISDATAVLHGQA
ncbi:MAG: hypothetical protein M1820_010073 [Bogoriella megaspora]|nr:MAG: hypothetical protein M1820_010073 [Bogoriella megaspora]